jgi:hypothetical protein
MTLARQFLTVGAACGRRERISHAKPAEVTRISKPRIHLGQPPSRINSPLENTELGYLKRN